MMSNRFLGNLPSPVDGHSLGADSNLADADFDLPGHERMCIIPTIIMAGILAIPLGGCDTVASSTPTSSAIEATALPAEISTPVADTPAAGQCEVSDQQAICVTPEGITFEFEAHGTATIESATMRPFAQGMPGGAVATGNDVQLTVAPNGNPDDGFAALSFANSTDAIAVDGTDGLINGTRPAPAPYFAGLAAADCVEAPAQSPGEVDTGLCGDGQGIVFSFAQLTAADAAQHGLGSTALEPQDLTLSDVGKQHAGGIETDAQFTTTGEQFDLHVTAHH